MELLTTIWAAIREETRQFFQLKKTERLWHIPVLASLCMGLPLLIGYALGRMDYGILSCIGGLVILYMPATALEHRMLTLLLCAFGFIISFAIGAVFSFNPILSATVLGLFAFGINWIVNYFALPPPRNFFFIMIASMASCMPFDWTTLPTKIGLIALGTIFACIFALFYSLYAVRKFQQAVPPTPTRPNNDAIHVESFIIGVFISSSLLIGHFFKLDNPYWIPISCLAVMQGLNVAHVGRRSFHRILGTFLGMGLTWILLILDLSPLQICFTILILQFIIEMLVVRHYALAVFFITPLTFFLAEIGAGFDIDIDRLIGARLLDIVIGSLIGVFGGWMLHNKQLQRIARWKVYMGRRKGHS
ncbi:FUSC family protein [Sphingobacterium sp. SYP-B4668]|uniref:FUSC family protein n=1 Tax=Sphingobacterium sp. SYP-B4668 TaxID=2996035 RepID=UPI0022DD2366|nr:FUSC family protein [Sphingobacterium sp. SYP-B4668]